MGETIGYGRHGKAERETTIATIAIGYADGFSRAFSKGVGEVLVNGQIARVIGNVCMDMTMIDITGIDAREGDEVIIFGKDLPVQKVAARINTIPYEILTNTSERVKRVFVAESIYWRVTVNLAKLPSSVSRSIVPFSFSSARAGNGRSP